MNRGTGKRWPFLFNRGDNNNSNSNDCNTTSTTRNLLSPQLVMNTSNRRRLEASGPAISIPASIGNSNSAARSKSSVQSVSPKSEIISASLPPVGLNGPTSFQFSPLPQHSDMSGKSNNGHDDICLDASKTYPKNIQYERQKYVSFLSSSQNIGTGGSQTNSQNATASGSPVRTIGSSTYSGEKRLFVLDLNPIWDEINKEDQLEDARKKLGNGTQNKTDIDAVDSDPMTLADDHTNASNIQNTSAETCVSSATDRHRREQGNVELDFDQNMGRTGAFSTTQASNFTTEYTNYLHEPDIVMKEYADPLLNTSLPFNRPYGCASGCDAYGSSYGNSRSIEGQQSASDDKNLHMVSEKSLSLEENLRRERQRVHSDGVTQFSWGCYNMPSQEKKVNGTPTSKPPTPEESSSTNGVPNMSHSDSSLLICQDGHGIRIVVPLRGNIYIQDGVGPTARCPLRLLYDKSMLEEDIRNDLTSARNPKGSKYDSKGSTKRGRIHAALLEADGAMDTGAIDPQLSPDGSMVAFVVSGEIYVMSCNGESLTGVGEEEFKQDLSYMEVDQMDLNYALSMNSTDSLLFSTRKPTQVTFGARIEEKIVSDENIHACEDSRDEDDGGNNDMSTSSVNSDDNIEQTKKYGRSVTQGLADFVAQEEMDRYQGFWWNKDSTGILFARVDESSVPPYRITHQGSDNFDGQEPTYEEHRYPFAGKANPIVTLGYIAVDRATVTGTAPEDDCKKVARRLWSQVKWFKAPEDASEYLARVNWLPDGTVCVQWQNRRQSTLLLVRIDVLNGNTMILHREQSDVWINLHHMFKVLPYPIHPDLCLESQDSVDKDGLKLPTGSFSYIFVSERTGYNHMYLYTYVPGDLSATLLRAISAGEWIVEGIAGVDIPNDLIYFTGTYKSPLEKHLFALPIINSSAWNDIALDENEVSGVRRSLRNVMSSLGGGSNRSQRRSKQMSSYTYPRAVNPSAPPSPLRLTNEIGMHSISMDESCRLFVDTCSDLTRPTTTKIYSIPARGIAIQTQGLVARDLKLRCVLYDATKDFDPSLSLTPPELLSFPTSDGTETLHAALYKPNPRLHGPGPYPLICAVYGGPHVQRVTRSWCQCADMRVQRLCSMGFAVVKCDNRGSSRRGLQFEGAIHKHLGRVEVLDQVTAVRHLIMKRIADPLRVGIHGWSYGGYLAAMCLCRAPDVFCVGIAGAPVTSWDGYDTHYTERYMGQPDENQEGYNESAVFEHIPNMRGKLLLIHGLIDENVHFRHTTRLINRLVAAGKDYDLLLFPDERHSPRRLRDRIYMEKRMCDYFVKHLLNGTRPPFLGNL